MKTKLLFGALAFLAFGLASCSSDAPDSPGAENQTTEWIGDKYICVRLNDVNSNTRGDDDVFNGEKFENGTADENKINTNNVRFYFFNENGQPFILSQTVNGVVSNTNMVIPTTVENAENTTNGNTFGTKVILVLGKPASEDMSSQPYIGNKPAKVVCITGLSDEKFTKLANQTIDHLDSNSEASIESLYSDKGFVMSNSTYSLDGTSASEIWATPIVETNFCDDQSSAESNPVDIYLERLVSKVRVSSGMGEKVAKTRNKTTNDNEDMEISLMNTTTKVGAVKVKVAGWNTRNEQASTKLKKDLFDNPDHNGYAQYLDLSTWATAAAECAWNSASHHRSFWAVTHGTENLNNKGDIDYSRLNVGQYGEVDSEGNPKQINGSTIKYIHPNTCDPNISEDTKWGSSLVNRSAHATALAFKAYVKLYDETGTLLSGTDKVADPEKGTSLIEWADQYYLEKDFINLIKDTYVKSFDDKDISKVTVKLISMGVDNQNYYTVQIEYDGTVDNRFDNRFNDIQWWKEGLTTYYINIKHATKSDGKTPIYGVVRNHIYDISIDNVIGLGIPGNVIEEPHDNVETYLAARINVLNWRLVSNTVNLE